MMRLLRRLPFHRGPNEGGSALIWVAGSLVVLLSMAAFAVDLGWVLLWNARLQSAADAAALAGVVNLPSFPSGATADAAKAAGANGFAVPAEASLSDSILPDNSYTVQLESDVDTFFLGVIGLHSFHIRQEATAQYIKPVRLGSRDNSFGTPSDQFWAAINAEFTEIEQGDPYAARCIEHNSIPNGPGCVSSTSACTAADLIGNRSSCYRADGYYYAVDVPAGASNLSVRFYDGGHHMDGNGNGTSDTGDRSWRVGWSPNGVELEYLLWPPDNTPTDPTDNDSNAGFVPACSDKFPVNGPPNEGHLNTWAGSNNCSVAGSVTEGIWVLQLPSPLTEGATKFGIEATVSGPQQPNVYGLLDMSIYVNFNNNQAEPDLAEVRPEHANREMKISIWDLGDVDAPASIRFINNTGGTPICSWTASNGQSAPSGSCIVDISNRRFNEHWLWVTIPIPGNYDCNPDPNGDGDTSDSQCWWKLHIESVGQTHDRTTWAAQIVGDPVRLTD